MKNTLIIIPVYNEEKYIADILKKVLNLYQQEVDILVVNDGSQDRTSRELIQFKDQIKIINHSINFGYGYSLMDGFYYSIEKGYNYTITMDSDGQHLPENIIDIVYKLDAYDIVSGSRYTGFPHVVKKEIKVRYYINMIITNIINALFPGYNITDSFCGFKGYRNSVLEELEFNYSGYEFPLDIWVQVMSKSVSIQEVKVPNKYIDINRNFNEVFTDKNDRLKLYLKTLFESYERYGKNYIKK